MSSSTRQPDPAPAKATRRTGAVIPILLASIVAGLTIAAPAQATMNLPRPVFATPAEGFDSVAAFACAPTLRAGTRSFADMIRAASGYSYGTTRPCNATWGARNSYHKTGRAVDVEIEYDRGAAERADGQVLLDWLFENGAERLRRLGVVEIIWGGRIWTTARDRSRMTSNIQGWRVYNGLGCPGAGRTNCHYDHFHFTLSAAGSEKRSTWWAAPQGQPAPADPTTVTPIIPAARFGGIAPASAGGYWLVERIGGVFSYGDAQFYGSLGGKPLVGPTVAISATPTRRGYLLAASDGGVFTFGDAAFHGSMGGRPLNAPVVGIAATPSGGGYWLTAADGGVFAFGDAPFHGSMGGKPLNAPVVGIAATPTGKGYWLTAADGGVFAFGDAPFHGSMGGKPLAAPVAGIAATPSGKGYWLVAADGGVFSYGDAAFHGSMSGKPLAAPVVAVAATPSGRGYWLSAGDGGVFAFGDAAFAGSVPEGSGPATAATREAAPEPEAPAGPAPALSIAPRTFAPVTPGASGGGTIVTYRAPSSGQLAISIQRRRSSPCPPRGACRSYVGLRGAKKVRARAGVNRYRFDGRLAGRRLSPGRYRMVLSIRSGKRKVAIGSERFTIKR